MFEFIFDSGNIIIFLPKKNGIHGISSCSLVPNRSSQARQWGESGVTGQCNSTMAVHKKARSVLAHMFFIAFLFIQKKDCKDMDRKSVSYFKTCRNQRVSTVGSKKTEDSFVGYSRRLGSNQAVRRPIAFIVGSWDPRLMARPSILRVTLLVVFHSSFQISYNFSLSWSFLNPHTWDWFSVAVNRAKHQLIVADIVLGWRPAATDRWPKPSVIEWGGRQESWRHLQTCSFMILHFVFLGWEWLRSDYFFGGSICSYCFFFLQLPANSIFSTEPATNASWTRQVRSLFRAAGGALQHLLNQQEEGLAGPEHLEIDAVILPEFMEFGP